MLKFELIETRQLPVLRANDKIDFCILARIDEAIRSGDIDGARILCDEILLSPILGIGWTEAVSEMKAEIVWRRRQRNKGSPNE